MSSELLPTCVIVECIDSFAFEISCLVFETKLLIVCADSSELLASLRISAATTAKLLPCSPARADKRYEEQHQKFGLDGMNREFQGETPPLVMEYI
jgi:hypothetical protein